MGIDFALVLLVIKHSQMVGDGPCFTHTLCRRTKNSIGLEANNSCRWSIPIITYPIFTISIAQPINKDASHEQSLGIIELKSLGIIELNIVEHLYIGVDK